jgi:hypothetical protein
MTLMHPNHDRDHPPQLPWTFPVIAGTAVVAVIAMALLERMAG